MISTVTLNPALDKTIYINKLMPNDTNRVNKVEMDAGGKGINCSRMLNVLGSDTLTLAFLGGKTGDFIKNVLQKENIKYEFVETQKPTRTCTDVEESGGVPPTTFNELGGPVTHAELVEMFEKAKDISRLSSYMVFGGSVPVGVNPDVYKVFIQIAAAGGAKAVLDADGESLVEGIKSRPFMIKPNLAEAQKLLGAELKSKADVARGALKLADEGIELVIISLGRQGAIAAYEGNIYDATSPVIKSVSSIGSGDSFVAGVLHGLSQDMSIEESLKLGCAAGASTAMSSGVEIGSKENIDKLLPEVKIQKLILQSQE